MGFVDTLKITARSGNGGDGVVRWLHEKFREYGGPSGGDGGRGGDVYIEGVRDVHLLSKYRHHPHFQAGDGGSGEKDELHGANGEDCVITLPLGSVVKNINTGAVYELLHENERIQVLTAGTGGRGNASFKSSRNRAPYEFTPGKPGESATFEVEIRLIADIGLVGMPNAGKSSLLNSVTQARAKVGDYPFTTLEPNLGDYHGYIIADIPGLIEGASVGKGLGHAFLRHVSRTRVIAHLVSCENDDPLATYDTIRGELEAYSEELASKTEIVILSKTDTIAQEKLTEIVQSFKNRGIKPLSMTLYEDAAVKSVMDVLTKTVDASLGA
jgi:GTP-binding protein